MKPIEGWAGEWVRGEESECFGREENPERARRGEVR